MVLVSGIGPGFSPDINASKNFGLQPPGYALYRLPRPKSAASSRVFRQVLTGPKARSIPAQARDLGHSGLTKSKAEGPAHSISCGQKKPSRGLDAHPGANLRTISPYLRPCPRAVMRKLTAGPVLRSLENPPKTPRFSSPWVGRRPIDNSYKTPSLPRPNSSGWWRIPPRAAKRDSPAVKPLNELTRLFS